MSERKCFNPCKTVDFFNGQACDKCVSEHYLPTPPADAVQARETPNG